MRLALVLILIGILLGIVIVAWSSLQPRDRQAGTKIGDDKKSFEAPVFEPRKQVRDVTPSRLSHTGLSRDGEMLERLPAIERPKPKSGKTTTRWPIPRVARAGILLSNGVRIELRGVVPTDPRLLCAAGDGSEWPCGGFARTALRNFIRNRTIVCNTADISNNGRMKTRCKVGNTDLSKWLVSNGWAEASTEELAEENKLAVMEERGIWGKQAP